MPLDQPWDMSQKNNELVQEFSVNRFNKYLLEIRFSNTDSSDFTLDQAEQLYKFIGRGTPRLYDLKTHEYIDLSSVSDAQRKNIKSMIDRGEIVKKYNNPGVIIPVYFKIEELNQNGVYEVVKERKVDTSGSAGGFARDIWTIWLHPGHYKITARIEGAVKVPLNLQTHLVLYADPTIIPPIETSP
jgi:hypothetical protein